MLPAAAAPRLKNFACALAFCALAP
jgi:hypothetical protein